MRERGRVSQGEKSEWKKNSLEFIPVPNREFLLNAAAPFVNDICGDVELTVEEAVSVETRAALAMAGLHPRLLDGEVADLALGGEGAIENDRVPAVQVLRQ